MWPIWDELKKRRAFREVWIGYLLGGAFFLLALYQTSGRDRWFLIQQDIYTYGDTLTAFLLKLFIKGNGRIKIIHQLVRFLRKTPAPQLSHNLNPPIN